MLVATALFCGLLALTHLIPQNNQATADFFAAPADCAMPCWAGIRPGVTHLDEALQILQHHPWIGHMAMEGELASGKTSALIWWHWNGQQSPLIDGSVDGRLISQNDVVQFVIVSTRVPMGDARLVLGPPSMGKLSRDAVDSTATKFAHLAVYDGLTLQSPATCPVRLTQLWHLPTQLYLYADWPGMTFTPYDLRDWLAAPPC
jgi:hypothetical protein